MGGPRFGTAAATVLLAAAFGAGGCAGEGARDRAAQSAPDEVLLSSGDLAAVARTDLAAGVPVQGTLEPAVDVTIVTPYPELVEAVLVKEGQSVRRGQLLARLRATTAEPAAESAEAKLRVAKAEHERMRNLYEVGAVARRDVEAAEAELRAAEAEAVAAQKRLDDARITAPDAGVIATRFVQGGDRVGDGDPLFRLVNTSELEVSANVPTEALDRVRPGAPVALVVGGLEGRTVTGRIARVNATVDPATRQVKVYVNVPNRDRRLAGDMFASGRVLLDTAAGVIAAPSSALRTSPDESQYVWVVEGGKIQRRPVTAGLKDEMRDLTEVRTGLKEGEQVIASPIEGLVAGQPVRVAGAADSGTPAGAPAASGPPARAGAGD
jgi:RND family efflux transporter MFP subunit